MPIHGCEQLAVWQRAMSLVVETYRVTAALPAAERFGLVTQARRAAVSVPANIAEGYGRLHRGDYVPHLSIARGSLMELRTLLHTAARLSYVTVRGFSRLWNTRTTFAAC